MIVLDDFIRNYVYPTGSYTDCGDSISFYSNVFASLLTFAQTKVDCTICFRFLTPRVGKEFSKVVVTLDSGRRQKNGQVVYFCIIDPESVEQAEEEMRNLLEEMSNDD